MARPIKWSRDLYPIRERATNSRIETWSRVDIERLFDVSRASAQTLMKAIGEVQPVGGTHFVERASLLSFLEAMIKAPDLDLALRERIREADAPPKPKALLVPIPADLRNATINDMPANIRISPGRLEIDAPTTMILLESLAALALVMQNDLDSVRRLIEPPQEAPPLVTDEDLQYFLANLRSTASMSE